MTALYAAVAAAAIAVAQPPPKPHIAQPVALENELLAATLLDAAETQVLLGQNGHGVRTWENDPVIRPFTHSPLTHVAAYGVLSAAIRLIPASPAKVWGLRFAVGVEAYTIGANARLLVTLHR